MLDRFPIELQLLCLVCGFVAVLLQSCGGRQTPERGLTGARHLETDFPAFLGHEIGKPIIYITFAFDALRIKICTKICIYGNNVVPLQPNSKTK